MESVDLYRSVSYYYFVEPIQAQHAFKSVGILGVAGSNTFEKCDGLLHGLERASNCVLPAPHISSRHGFAA